MVSSSPSGQDQQQTPPPPPQVDGSKVVTIAAAAAAASRRLPPPCWSHDETVALIDAYRDKWYSLRRGNLRATHWQDVADDVGIRCPISTPKTAVQCRHKMEKLRKRYRAEIQRAVPYGGNRGHRYCSAWIHFKRMDAMEKGTNSTATAAGATSDDDDEDEQEDLNVKRIGDVYHTNNMNNSSRLRSRNHFHEPMTNGGSGFRIRIPGKNGISGDAAGAKGYSKFDDIGGQSSNYGASKGFGGRGEIGKRVAVDAEAKKGDPVEEMVEAIKLLGDGFVRMEKMKMDMAREVEEMRMEMEMKRTERILESQQKIVEAFAKAISEGGKSKKMKRMPDDEC